MKFIDYLGKMDLTDKTMFWLCSLEDLEKGYCLLLERSKKKKFYLRSIGYHHLIVYDYFTDEEVEDWDRCTKEEFEENLRNFIKEYKIKEVSCY